MDVYIGWLGRRYNLPNERVDMKSEKIIIKIIAYSIFMILLSRGTNYSQSIPNPLYWSFYQSDNYLSSTVNPDSIKIGTLWLVDANGDGKLDSSRIGPISWSLYADSTNKALRDAAGNIINLYYLSISQFSTHSSNASAHHTKTTSISDLTDFPDLSDSTNWNSPDTSTTLATKDFVRDSTLSVSGSLDNPSYVGDMTLYGNLREMGVKSSIDIERINFQEATSHLNILIPEAYYTDITSDVDSLNSYKNQGIHPDIIYIPQGFVDANGDRWKYILIESPYPNGSSPTEVENPCIHVSNDNVTWTLPTGATNPIADTSDFTAPAGYSKYPSDPGLFWDEIGNKIWAFFRVTLGGNYSPPSTIEPDTNKIYVMSTTDLVTWTTPTVIVTSVTNDIIQGTTRADTLAAMGKALLSPAIVLDTSGTYRMITVESNGCYGYLDSSLSTNVNYDNTMTLWSSTDPDSGWDTVQTIDASPPEPTIEPYIKTNQGGISDTSHEEFWHQDITVVNADLTLMFLKTTNIGGTGANGALYIGYSTDNCRSFTFRDRPIIDGMRHQQNPESSDYTYKASGILVESENETKIGLYYSAFGDDDVLGISKARYTYYTESNYLEDTLAQLVVINDSEMRVYGRYDAIQSSDSLVLTQSVWDNATANTYLFIDSSYDAVISSACTDTVALTFQSPGYCIFDSLIIAFQGNSTTSYLNQVELLGDYKIGISEDTSTSHQNLASYNATTYKYIVNDTNYTSTSLARKAIPLMTANFADSAGSFVFREGERGQIRLIMNIHHGGFMKVSYIQLKGRVVDRIDDDRQDERYHLR